MPQATGAIYTLQLRSVSAMAGNFMPGIRARYTWSSQPARRASGLHALSVICLCSIRRIRARFAGASRAADDDVFVEHENRLINRECDARGSRRRIVGEHRKSGDLHRAAVRLNRKYRQPAHDRTVAIRFFSVEAATSHQLHGFRYCDRRADRIDAVPRNHRAVGGARAPVHSLLKR
jgi:hypothetical protein